MSDNFKVCQKNTVTEFVEKKSRFITSLAIVQTEDEAKAFIDSVRAQYKDATHNCYAYRLRTPRVERFSDDGEPAGTAGMPMLEVLKKEDVYDVCVVVTRYFGGILLGGGGLIRAYSKGVSMSVSDSGFAYRYANKVIRFNYGYAGHSRVQKILENVIHNELSCDFGVDITLTLSVKTGDCDSLIETLTDALGGALKYEIERESFDSFKN